MLHKYKPITFDEDSGSNGNAITAKLLHQKSTYFSKQWFSYSIPIACSIALLSGLSMAINPVCGNLSSGSGSSNGSGGLFGSNGAAYAEGGDSESDYGISTQADATTLTLTMTGNPDGSTPSSTTVTAGTVAYRPYTFKATTNGAYRVYVQAASGYSGNLKGLANPNEQITGVGTNVDPKTDNFATNTWGYSLTTNTSTANANLTYSTVPENGTLIQPSFKSDTAAASGQNFKLVFAAKIGDKPADHYQTKVLLSLAAGASEVASLSTITYMQDMTSTICSNTPIEPALGSTKQLVDKRDQKKYWVTRLQDGNCWMTQNLDFDLPTGTNVTVKAEGTNLASDQTGLTITGFTVNGVTGWKNDNALLQYYDPGLWVYTQPTELSNCTSVVKLSNCTGYGWKEYFGGDPESEHYLVGNYYSWKAVTVNTATDTNKNAAGSVCPAGWKIPYGGSISGNGSFRTLLNSYQFEFVDIDGAGNLASASISSTGQNIASAPLYFLRNGNITMVPDIYLAGSRGALWARNISTTTMSYALSFIEDLSIDSAFDYFRGNPVRCVVISS